MITHDDLNKEVGGLMAETRMTEGLYYLIDLANKAPGEIHRFEIVGEAGGPLTVVLASSAESRGELEGRLA